MTSIQRTQQLKLEYKHTTHYQYYTIGLPSFPKSSKSGVQISILTNTDYSLVFYSLISLVVSR